MENGIFEGVESLQAQVANHRKLLREVDSSLKRLSGNANGNDKSSRRDNNPRHGNMNSSFNAENRMNPMHRHANPAQQQHMGGQRDMMRGLVRKASLGNENDRMVPYNDRHMDQHNDSRPGLKRKSYDSQYQSGGSAKRIVNSSFNYTSQPDPDSGDEDERHMIKSSVVSTAMPIKTKEDLIKIQNKGVNVQRNKRIFGHLLGTLSQFKSDDKVRSNTTQAIHRKELEAKIEINKAEEIKRLTEEKKKLEGERVRHSQLLELLESKMRVTQEFESWRQNQMRLRKFIRTKTKPYVFYMPKEMNEETRKLVEDTAALIDEQIAKRLKETTGELEALKRKEVQLHKESEAASKDSSETAENKENKDEIEEGEGNEKNREMAEDTFDNDEMDEDKISANNVQLGDDGEESGSEREPENIVVEGNEKISQEKEDNSNSNISETDKVSDEVDGMED